MMLTLVKKVDDSLPENYKKFIDNIGKDKNSKLKGFTIDPGDSIQAALLTHINLTFVQGKYGWISQAEKGQLWI